MKLFIVAALIAAVSAARLEHLERGYLPPAQNNYGANSGGSSFPAAGAHGNFGFNQGSQYNAPGRGSNGLGTFGRANDFVTTGAGSNGFGASGHGSNGFGTSGHGSNGFGANRHGSNGFGNNGRESNGFGSSYGANGASGRNGGSSAANFNQYLPPNYGSNAGSTPQSSFGSSIRPSCSNCAFGGLPSLPRYQSSFDSQPSGHQNEQAGASRQYLAPKTSSQNAQQPFDENTGYIY